MSFYFNPNSTSTQFFLDSNQHSISGTSQGFNALCLSNQIHNNTRLREQFIYENKVLFMNDPNLSKISHIVLSSLGNIHHEILTRSNLSIIKYLGATCKYWQSKSNEAFLWQKIGRQFEPNFHISTKDEV